MNDTFGTPTQVVHPWRAVIRTIFQALAGMAATWIVVTVSRTIGVDLSGFSDAMRDSIAYSMWVLFTGLTTWVMNRARVNDFIERVTPLLATGVHAEAREDMVGDRPNAPDRGVMDAVGIPTDGTVPSPDDPREPVTIIDIDY